MKLTLRQLADSQQALQELAFNNQLPVRTAYWAGKVVKKAQKEMQHYLEERKKILESLGKPPESGKGDYVFPTPEIKAECLKKLEDLLDTDTELPGDPFTLEGLGNATLSPASLAQLDWLIVE